MESSTDLDHVLRSILNLQEDAGSFCQGALKKVLEATAASNKIPSGEVFSIRVENKEFSQHAVAAQERVANLLHQVLEFADEGHYPTSEGIDIHSAPDRSAKYELIQEALERMFERIDNLLKEDEVEEQPTRQIADFGRRSGKPQWRWKHIIDNFRAGFVPALKSKPHASEPLHSSIAAAQSGSSQSSSARLPHPYAAEIRAVRWPPSMVSVIKPELYKRLEDTPLVMIADKQGLRHMLDELRAQKPSEIAIDLEHHNKHSFRGFTCLIQMSTRSKDFIIDPFDLMEDLTVLNEITADPSIVKVLHGADSDVMWLQRDFSVYIVNMFDTGQATRVLDFGGGYGLANLIQFYCNHKPDKKYQLADWRQRPLPKELVDYARADTHYLLYAYDRLRNALLTTPASLSASVKADMLKQSEVGNEIVDSGQALLTTIERSNEIALRVYYEEPFDAEKTMEQVCSKHGRQLSPVQAAALRALLTWRDTLARQLDESTDYVVLDAVALRIAQTSPQSVRDLLSCVNPVPAIVKQYADDIVGVIRRAQSAAATPARRKPVGSPLGSPVVKPDSASASPAVGVLNSAFRNAGWIDPPAKRFRSDEEPRGLLSAIKPITRITSGRRREKGSSSSQPALFEPWSSDSEDEGSTTARSIFESFRYQQDVAVPVLGAPEPFQEEDDANLEGGSVGDIVMEVTGTGFLSQEVDEELDESALPKSLQQVYNLSNKKKGLKGKKKKGDGEASESQLQAASGKSTENQFMNDLGWPLEAAVGQAAKKKSKKTDKSLQLVAESSEADNPNLPAFPPAPKGPDRAKGKRKGKGKGKGQGDDDD